MLTLLLRYVQELEKQLFEELEPRAILAKRGGGEGEDAQPLEYLVHWGDGAENTWEVRTPLHLACAAVLTRTNTSSLSATSPMTSSPISRLAWSTPPPRASLTGDAAQ